MDDGDDKNREQDTLAAMRAQGLRAMIFRYCSICDKDTLQELLANGQHKCSSCFCTVG